MSKTIGNMTLKAAPVGTDMVAIADSEDLDKTKKVLLSAISGGGGESHIHWIKNASYDSSTKVLSGIADDVTSYVDGDLYAFYFPENVSGNVLLKVDVNSLGALVVYRPGLDTYQFNGVFKQNWLMIFTYKSYLPGFFLAYADTFANSFMKVQSNMILSSCSIIPTSNTYTLGNTGRSWTNIYVNSCPVDQEVSSSTSTTPTIDLNNSSNYHKVFVYTLPLTSLTLTNVSSKTFEQEIQFTTDSTFTFTASGLTGKWLGVSAPTFDPNTSYVIAIKNGYAVCSKVGA